MDKVKKASILRSLPLLRGLNESEIESLAEATTAETLSPGSVFINQEDESSTTYFIFEGSVRVYRITEDGEEVNLAVLGASEVVGEMSLLDNEPRSASVETLQEAKILALRKQDFEKVLLKHPEMAIRLLGTLSQRIRVTNEFLEDTFSKTLSERTWKTLQTLVKYFPKGDITLSHEELASIVGANRSRITEVLDNLAREGKIALSHKKISIL